MSGKWISGPAAFLLLVLFFLPWVMVSCNGEPIGQLSGFELATGSNTDLPVDPDFQLLPAAGGGDIALFFIPLMALFTVGILGLIHFRPTGLLAGGVGQGAAAVGGLLVLFLEWRLLQGAQGGVFEISIMPALWGTVVALLLILIGGVVDVALGLRRGKVSLKPVFNYGGEDSVPFPQAGGPAPQATPAPPMPGGAMETDTADSWQSSSFAQSFSSTTDPGATQSDTPDAEPYQGNYGATRVDSEEIASQFGPLLKGTTPLPGEAMFGETAVEPEDAAQEWNPPPPFIPSHPRAKSGDGSPATKLPLAWLVIREGPKAGEQYRLHKLTRIGRGPENEIILADSAVSGSHGQVSFADGLYIYQDLGSTNGSLQYNQDTQQWQRVDHMPLTDGAQLKLGRVVLHFMSV